MLDPAVRAGAPHGVVITGVAATASLGADAESIWKGVLAGRCGMGPMPDMESALPPGSLGGQAVELPHGYRPDLPREARYLRWTLEHALRHAGLTVETPYAPTRRCAVLGTTLHGMRAGGRFLRSGAVTELSSFLASATSLAALDGLGVQGGALTTCSACSSSLGAVALGVTILESGQADLVLAGGYDAISEYAWAGFNSLRLIAEGPLRPFCRDRQGMKVAEGYGIVILERAESAARRNATVLARLAGWGESADSHHLTQPHPLGEGALTAMLQALRRAGARPADLGMVAAHATGTPENDEAEFQSLTRLFGDSLPGVPVVGFKSFLGHTLGGAGAVELVLSCMAIRDQRLPACPNVRPEQIQYPGLNVASGEAMPHDLCCTLNTSLGFGGANTCVVLTDPRCECPPSPAPKASSGQPEAWITGVGVLLPGAVGHAEFIDRRLQRDTSTPAQSKQLIDDAAMSEYLIARRVRRLSQYVKFTLASATMAVRDAGFTDDPKRLADAGAIVGSMHGSADFCHDYYSQIVSEGALAANPVLFAEGVPNAAAAHLSSTLGLKGACQTIIGARTAGLDSLALGALRIQSGAADTLIIVAAEAPCGVVDQAYIANGLQTNGECGLHTKAARGFQRAFGAVAFVLESSFAASARGAVPYARVLEGKWASCASPSRGGPASAVASVLSRLQPADRVIGSACRTWVDRAEALGLRRAGIPASGDLNHGFDELFSVGPLAACATELVDGRIGERFSLLCTDFTGSASAVQVERLHRRLGTPLASSKARP